MRIVSAVLLAVLLAVSMAPSEARHLNAPAVHLTPAVEPGILVNQPILITNPKAVATGTYEQRLDLDSTTIPALNSNWTNAAFYYANGTAIPAWIEANASSASHDTVIYLRLYSIGASSSITIRLHCYAKTTFDLSSAGPIGESPKLGSTYAAWDDGTTVFPAYDDFRGTSLNGMWVSSLASGSVTVNNGLTASTLETGGATQASCGIVLAKQNVTTAKFTVSLYGSTGSDQRSGPFFSTTNTNTCATTANTLVNSLDPTATSLTQWTVFHETGSGSYSTDTVSFTWVATANYEWNLQSAPAGANTSVNRSTALHGVYGNITETTVYPGIWLKSQAGPTTIGPFYYFLERTDPASGVQPTYALIPRAPTQLNVTALSSSVASLTWVGSPGTVTNYTVWRWNASTCGGGPVHAYSEGVVTNATLSALNATSTYSLEIAGFNSSGQGDLSACVSVTTPPPPFITAEVVSGTVILGVFIGVGVAGLVALTAGSRARDRRRSRRGPGPP